MAVTPNLELLAISESQTQKATAINTALAQMEGAISSSYTLNTDAAVTASFDVVIPFDDSNDLSDRTALRMIYLDIAPGATDVFNVIHPDNPHLFFAKNRSAHNATVKTAAGSGFTIEPTKTAILYCDGTNVIDISGFFAANANVIQAHDFEVSVYDKPTSGQVIGRFLVARETTLAADFGGSIGNVVTNPTAVNVFDVDQDGTLIGQISVATDGAVTFTTVGNTEKIVPAGAILTVHNQAVADATLANLNVVLAATISVVQP